MTTQLRVETLTLPGASLGEENPLPFFRDPAVNSARLAHPSLPAEKQAHLGWETAFRVLPYRMQDHYTRSRQPLDFNAVVLENEFLKATFFPELGARLVSLFYKPLQRELLHRNPVFQPANLAIRNAWFSGGIEWNIGQFGHTFTTCSPLFAAATQGEHGEPGLRVYEFERCKRLFWQIDFYLPPGLPFLVAYTRVCNPNPEAAAMYWWTNIAAEEASGVRVLAPAAQAIYFDHNLGEAAFGLADLPALPSLGGVDGTYSLNSTFANEFFFQCDAADMPWEAALDASGAGLVEASTPRLKYRKLFCWGTHPGGRHWQEFLSQPGQAYLEIQAGLAPTQLHGLPMPAGAVWDWTQAFGFVEADPLKVHGADWPAAWGAVDAALKQKLPTAGLARIEAGCRARADLPSAAVLQSGSGWGALELRRRAAQSGAEPVSPAFFFPESSLGAEQHKWLALLERGALPEQDPALPPGEWMAQPEWERLLEESTHTVSRSWLSLLHLGVMRLERFDRAGARAAWLESLRLKPSAWALRNLAALCLQEKDAPRALEYYRQGWELGLRMDPPPADLAVEYLQQLAAAGQYAGCREVYAAFPNAIRDTDRVQLLRAQFSLELGDLDAVEEVLRRDFAVVREGEIVLTDLWFELQARRESQRSGKALDAALREQVRALYPPPARIDFRSINE